MVKANIIINQLNEVLENLVTNSEKAMDEELFNKRKYYSSEYYRVTFAVKEITLFKNSFEYVAYVPNLERWAAVMDNNKKFIGETTHPYMTENPPILFFSGVTDCVLDEYMYKYKDTNTECEWKEVSV